MRLSPILTRILRLGLCVLALAAAAGAARAAVSTALTPAIQSVQPGTDFDVFVDVSSAGSAFNGFDVVVSFDPGALTLLPTNPTTLQQGCLMTGSCSAACGNTFHVFSAAGDSIAVSDVLLCNSVSLTGPGHVYHLRFHAGNTTQVTQLSLRRAKFYNAGLFVTPVSTTSCQVGIGVQVGVGAPVPGLARPLRVEPNPTFGRVDLVSEDEAAGLVEVNIVDLQGRLVQHVGPAWLGPHSRLGWDGRDSQGARVPAGLYLVRIRRGGQVQNARVILLP